MIEIDYPILINYNLNNLIESPDSYDVRGFKTYPCLKKINDEYHECFVFVKNFNEVTISSNYKQFNLEDIDVSRYIECNSDEDVLNIIPKEFFDNYTDINILKNNIIDYYLKDMPELDNVTIDTKNIIIGYKVLTHIYRFKGNISQQQFAYYLMKNNVISMNDGIPFDHIIPLNLDSNIDMPLMLQSYCWAYIDTESTVSKYKNRVLPLRDIYPN